MYFYLFSIFVYIFIILLCFPIVSPYNISRLLEILGMPCKTHFTILTHCPIWRSAKNNLTAGCLVYVKWIVFADVCLTLFSSNVSEYTPFVPIQIFVLTPYIESKACHNPSTFYCVFSLKYCLMKLVNSFWITLCVQCSNPTAVDFVLNASGINNVHTGHVLESVSFWFSFHKLDVGLYIQTKIFC